MKLLINLFIVMFFVSGCGMSLEDACNNTIDTYQSCGWGDGGSVEECKKNIEAGGEYCDNAFLSYSDCLTETNTCSITACEEEANVVVRLCNTDTRTENEVCCDCLYFGTTSFGEKCFGDFGPSSQSCSGALNEKEEVMAYTECWDDLCYYQCSHLKETNE